MSRAMPCRSVASSARWASPAVPLSRSARSASSSSRSAWIWSTRRRCCCRLSWLGSAMAVLFTMLSVGPGADPVSQSHKGQSPSRSPQDHLEQPLVVLKQQSMGVAGNAEPVVSAEGARPHLVPSHPLLAQCPTAMPAQALPTGPHHADVGHAEILPQGSPHRCGVTTADLPWPEAGRGSLQGLQQVEGGSGIATPKLTCSLLVHRLILVRSPRQPSPAWPVLRHRPPVWNLSLSMFRSLRLHPE